MTLHDLTSSPWCDECGFVPSVWPCAEHVLRPALFTRLPSSMPEGLEWDEVYKTWMLRAALGFALRRNTAISDAHAEKLCVGHWLQMAWDKGDEDAEQFNKLIEAMRLEDGSLVQVLVIALHRLCDSQESKP